MSEALPPLFEYSTAQDRFDELRDDAGLRPHVRPFFAALSGLSRETLQERERFVRKDITADGVTYNVYADSMGDKRPWDLDVLPLLLAADEHQALAAGVAQRARLLNRVLADLLGPQKLLAEGLLPPALVFGQLGYPWPAVGVVPPGGVFLHLYAADVARSPDGRFWILADRTQAPSGAAYALQNRITMSRAFPDVLRDIVPAPLGGFFSALQESLSRLAPSGGEPPLVVLLSPGPYNETYFEHVFLARHLGFPLVLGQDLTVRNDKVFLKTLRGLRRVHGILRRLDDDYCDPAELRSDSALGVPGLVAAARAGNVLIANAIGSGILETGALHAFLPAICERLLGERLLLPAVASFWCGERPALEYACDHFDDLVIKPAYSSMRMEPVFGHTLAAAEKARVKESMRGQPHAYLAQEWIHLSRAPVLASGNEPKESAFVGRSVSMRLFAVAFGDGYQVMSGALARVSPREGDIVSMQWGGLSKDTWVVAGPKDEISASTFVSGPSEGPSTSLFRGAPRGAGESTATIPSRVAESLFWMGRYSERCEGAARLLRAALLRIADAAPDAKAALRSIAGACTALGITASSEGELLPMFLGAATDPAVPGGLPANVGRLEASAGQLRERMSTDNWHVLNRLSEKLPGPCATVSAALVSLDEIMLACVSLAGFALDDMTRDESWRFLLLGRRMERLTHLSAVISTVLSSPDASRRSALEWLLEAANSIVTYRARYRRAPELLPVIDLVVHDGSNPHSVGFQLHDLLRTLETSAEELQTPMPGAELTRLSGALSRWPAERLFGGDGSDLDAGCASLAALLGEVRAAALALSDDLHAQLFSHVSAPAPLGT